jgi:hypothetical protein
MACDALDIASFLEKDGNLIIYCKEGMLAFRQFKSGFMISAEEG